MKIRFLVLLIFFPILSFGQTAGIIRDSISNNPVPYVNIWVENENYGTTSNENGLFSLNLNGNGKTIIFSSIGYETKRINADRLNKVIILQPKITGLKEVVVKANKQKKENVIGKFKKSDIDVYYSCDNATPRINARFFEFEDIYNKTPFLKKFRLLTVSMVENSRFNIRLYSVNENGEPGDYIYDKNIICTAQKGYNITEIDISKYRIRFPEKGLFVAIEWLIIESNKYSITTELFGNTTVYAPTIGALPSQTDKNSWLYSQGRWKKEQKNKSIAIKAYKDKYYLLAIELTLTN